MEINAPKLTRRQLRRQEREAAAEAKKRRNARERAYKKKLREDPAYMAAQKQWQRDYRAKPEVKILQRHANYIRRYGISAEDIDKMRGAQNYACAICGSPFAGHNKLWHVDHCHTTGKVRGILCPGCNLGLGAFRDSACALRNAAAYIEAQQ